jgi:hypothetical protein
MRLAEPGVGLATFRISGLGRLALQLLEEREASGGAHGSQERTARSHSKARAMRSAAKEAEAPDEPTDLSKQAAYPVRIAAIDPDVVEQLRPVTQDPAVQDQPQERGDGELPWDGPELDDLSPQTRHLLKYMLPRDQADIADLVEDVWGKDSASVSNGSIHTAISKANAFLAKQSYPRFLKKVRGETIVRWE